jgi:hypothetical protein
LSSSPGSGSRQRSRQPAVGVAGPSGGAGLLVPELWRFLGCQRADSTALGMPHKSSRRHRGLGDALGAGEDDLIPLDDESLFLGLGQISLYKLRRHLAGRRVSALLL